MLFFFWQGVTLGFPAAMIPGPLQAYFLAQTMRLGWRRTLPATLAPLISDGPIVILVLFVLTQLPAAILTVLQLCGGIYLLYLAAGALRSLNEPPPTAESAQNKAVTNVFKASLINLLNPNPYIFWSTVGGVRLLQAWRDAAGFGVAFLFGFYLTLIGGFVLFILLFGVMRRSDNRALNRALILLSVIALLFFAVFFQIIPALSTI